MSLYPGARLGPYEILSALGAGGMGEVYRARDTKLGRDVAIKILPEAFASDPERLARFEREARTLASLNHPHIAQVHAVEDRALVMELVEGDDLSQRIAKGAIPIDEALPIAKQIAAALEAAHAQGVIHRDLKPANVKVRPDGTVKVLDFGLAKAMDRGSGIRDQGSGDAANSPTLSIHATEAGMILGTAAYMSPEQARGKAVDQRADIWAFGCVLFEMLSARRAFPGDEITDVLAKVIEREPGWAALPPSTPATVRALLRKCLRKDSSKRLHHIADARLDLEDTIAEPPGAPSSGARTSSAARWRERTAWSVAALMTLAALAVTAVSLRPAGVDEPISFEVGPRPGHAFRTGGALQAAISPDGRRIVYQAYPEGSNLRLFVRALDQVEARALPGTEWASSAFWSPDGRVVAFFRGGQLLRSDLSGGPPQIIAAVPPGTGEGAWGTNGIILLGNSGAGLSRVPATGGALTTVTTLGDEDRGHTAPFWLPDQRRFIYRATNGTVFLGSIDGGVPTKLMDTDGKVEFAPPDTLLFPRGTALMAQTFDPVRGELRGEPIRLADPIRTAQGGRASFWSHHKVLAYRLAGSESVEAEWHLYDAGGRQVRPLAPVQALRAFALSPDGRSIAVHEHDDLSPNGGLWLLEMARGTLSRIGSSASHDDHPVWSPDGRRLAIQSSRGGGGLWLVAPGSNAPDERLLDDRGAVPTDWSADGQWVVYHTTNAKTGTDIFAVPTAGTRVPRAAVQTPYDELYGALSPDGRWLAYTSTETTESEIYVQPFPPTGSKTRISTSGGSHAKWAPSGQVLYFWGADGRIMRVNLTRSNGAIEPGNPEPVFMLRVAGLFSRTNRPPYTLGPDGAGFIGAQAPAGIAETPLTVIVNWRARLSP